MLMCYSFGRFDLLKITLENKGGIRAGRERMGFGPNAALLISIMKPPHAKMTEDTYKLEEMVAP